jgi:hypothetical protein
MKRNINLTDIKEEFDRISEKQKETFKFHNIVEPVLLQKGDKLWRTVKSRGNIRSSYWLDSGGMDVIFSDFFHRLRINQEMKMATDSIKAFADVDRNRSSIKEEWQDIFNRVVCIAMRKPVYAYYGIIGPQEDERKKKLYDGGAYQYVIPRFQYYKDQNQWDTIDEYITVVEYPTLMQSSWFKRYNYNYELTS